MADTCTCRWTDEEIGGGYVRAVLHKQPDCPGHGHLVADDGPVNLWERRVSREGYPGYFAPGSESWLWGREVDERRRAKHLTDAETAAETWKAMAWCGGHGRTAITSDGVIFTECAVVDGPPTREEHELATLRRFATHDQAV